MKNQSLDFECTVLVDCLTIPGFLLPWSSLMVNGGDVVGAVYVFLSADQGREP